MLHRTDFSLYLFSIYSQLPVSSQENYINPFSQWKFLLLEHSSTFYHFCDISFAFSHIYLCIIFLQSKCQNEYESRRITTLNNKNLNIFTARENGKWKSKKFSTNYIKIYSNYFCSQAREYLILHLVLWEGCRFSTSFMLVLFCIPYEFC